MTHEHLGHDTRIGPSDKQRQKDQERALLRGADKRKSCETS